MDGFAMSRLDKFGTQFDRWGRAMKRDARPSWRIVSGIASVIGAKFKFSSAEDVFNEIAQTVLGFKGMSYKTIGNKGLSMQEKRHAGVPTQS